VHGLSHEPDIDEVIAASGFRKRSLQGVRINTLAIYERINDLQ